MLKFLRETLSIGDFVEVETSTGLVRGSILEIPPDCLVMLTDGELHEYSEEQLLSIKYFSDDHDAYRDCYIQKFIPEERVRDIFGQKTTMGRRFARISTTSSQFLWAGICVSNAVILTCPT